jgi:hypothetical protein
LTEPARDNDADRSKASFKLDLLETVNADPVLEPSDLKLVAAYTAVMSWPKREAWLSASRVRAMTGLSDRQVRISRARLAGENSANRSYLRKLRQHGSTTIFAIDNPWLEDSRQHVAAMTDHFRDLEREKKALTRSLSKAAVPATIAGTEDPLSLSPGDRDVPATIAANIPSDTPQKNLSEEEGTPPIKVSSVPLSYGDREDDPHQPYPVPTSEDEALAMLDQLRRGANLSSAVLGYFRRKLWAGELTPHMVAEQRSMVA